MINYCFNPPQFTVDLLDISKIFAPTQEYQLSQWDDAELRLEYFIVESRMVFNAKFINSTYTCKLELKDWNNLEYNRNIKRYAKICLYNCLKDYYKQSFAWGSLTGIRPTKFARDLGLDCNSDLSILSDFFDVSDNKVHTLRQVLKAQEGLINTRDDCVDIYIGIPFCTSICSYCSFSSGLISAYKHLVEPFLQGLYVEIQSTLALIKRLNLKINCVYVGGGTPTSLNAEQLNLILSQFKYLDIKEFTVEAGRPDTIDRAKLKVLADNNVNRISINPQSFNESTLSQIGRNHSIKQIYDAYELAGEYNFIINMDLIAGIGNETIEQFNYSLQQALSLKPDNITVHTLALKRGSFLSKEFKHNSCNVSRMVDNAHNLLTSNLYMPYYLYRQKYCQDNLENIGYSKANKQCLYNINTMEESINIIACGCNAISKKLFGNNRIERYANPKDVITYINKLNILNSDKEKLFTLM